MSMPKNILVPVDFSEMSARALAYAEDFAETLNATLHLVHVIPDPQADPWLGEATHIDLGSLLKTWEADAQQRLGNMKPDRVPAELGAKVGQPSKAIMDYAREHAIDLIIMGTHGRGTIEHALLGSVAERVVRKAPCPVLTVR